jgi:predicted TIM-barrel fold metal-dependent hydrolase
MKYTCISADCHIDLIWLPPDLFTGNASAALKARMPHVVDGDDGPVWVTEQGARFGLMNGMGSGGRKYVPGQIHRSDRMAETGLFTDGEKGIRRLTDPALRVKDQDRDGIQAEVLYGILGASQRLNDPAAATEVMRIYNEWLDGFCKAAPDRFAGLASIPNHDMDAAVAEIKRVAKRGGVRGVEVSKTHDMKPLYDPSYAPVWEAASEAGLPVHFHTIGGKRPNFEDMPPLQARQAFAIHITGFQLAMAHTLMEIIYGGVVEAYPKLKVVIGEAGIGWIPYILQHMDLEWEDQFKDLTLTMKPSDYWRRQCRATYQSDRVGVRLLDMLGEETVMWGSDFPHPDGVWPDSQDFIAREFADMPDALRHKVTCENAGKFYGFM